MEMYDLLLLAEIMHRPRISGKGKLSGQSSNIDSPRKTHQNGLCMYVVIGGCDMFA